jgi:ubiquinone/menaquinone biosynthesis C-methylase UbiE
MNTLKKIANKLKRLTGFNATAQPYDFNANNPLGGNGERVDIQLNKNVAYHKMDMYQKSHWKRYEFAKKLIASGEVCGDFACGTGYGTVLLSENASEVIGADINKEVIDEIKIRYQHLKNVSFRQLDLLALPYTNYFDVIVSFETLEHFTEGNVKSLLGIYHRALKSNGRLIFSTPYLQENSDEALKMGFHLTFFIDEKKINSWLAETGFKAAEFLYQNYQTHHIKKELTVKEFVICVAQKIQ